MWTETKHGLYKQFVFADFHHAWAFMEQVSGVVNRLGHHPRWQNEWNVVEFWLSTHEPQQGITDRDWELAREIDQRRQAEAELRAAQVGLQSRVAQRSLELDAANQALSKSEARLALALKASELGLWDWNLQTDEVHHTRLKELFGIEPEFITEMLSHLKPRLHPKDLPPLRRALVAHLKGRSEDYQIEYRVRHGDGHWVWIEDRGRAVERGPDGRVLRMVGTRRDISASTGKSG